MDYGHKGKELFQAYCDAVGGVTYDGKEIQSWEDVTYQVREGWIAVARTAFPQSDGESFMGGWRADLEPRRKLQISWAAMYDTSAYRHGANGHNDLLLISWLSDKLDSYENTIERLLEDYRANRDSKNKPV